MLKRYLKITLITVISITLLLIFRSNASAEIIINNENKDNMISLTFDDGPSNENIDKILEILDKYKIKATFFVLGEKAAENPEKLKLIHDKGHEIANHTYSHCYICKICDEKMKKEILDTETIIEKITGEKPKLFRPPGGLRTNEKIKEIEDLGYKCIYWSIDSRDWSCPDFNQMVKSVEKDTKSGDILLFHDLQSKNIRTVEAIDEIIPYLMNKGFKFVTCSELINNN